MVVALDQESKRVGHVEFVVNLRRSEAENVHEGANLAEFLREHEQ